MEGIIRTPNEKETQDFIPIVNPGAKKSVKDEFNQKLGEEQLKAIKKGLPFCDRAARDDFNEGYEDQVKKVMREFGYIKADEIKPVKIDWKKYADLNNFELIEEGEVSDEYLTKKNPGLDVLVEKKVYKFKGYSNRYTVMEDAPSAIRRARTRLEELKSVTKK